MSLLVSTPAASVDAYFSIAQLAKLKRGISLVTRKKSASVIARKIMVQAHCLSDFLINFDQKISTYVG